MQAENLVTSTWELSTRGPARRVYELTSDGRDLLESWAMTLDLNRAILGRFLDRYGQLDVGPPPAPRSGTRVVMSNVRGGQSA